jgi:hypothetical protein
MKVKANLANRLQAALLLIVLAGCDSVSSSSDPASASARFGASSRDETARPISGTPATPASAGMPLATKYPGDVGIGGDPSVVWHEDFEEGTVTAVVGRYDSYVNSAGMSLVADRPGGSSGASALALVAGGNSPTTNLYKGFGAGYDELYFRYYAKYVGSGPWHHTGLWIGGYNPPLSYPYPRAGRKPAGTDLFSIGLEPIPSYENVPMDFYAYWRGMNSWKAQPAGAVGDYYGNTLLHDAKFRMQSNTWVCYEIHLKVNSDPAAGTGGVLEVWQNDALIRRFDDTGPSGYWVKDKFCPVDANGSECTEYRPANPAALLLDQQWRSTGALKVNYFWPQNYNTDGPNSTLILDDMVVATRRIGCTLPR